MSKASDFPSSKQKIKRRVLVKKVQEYKPNLSTI